MDLGKRLDRPVVLVGLMGVGKSTVGRRLARRLGLPFVDSDSAIEDAVGFPAGGVFVEPSTRALLNAQGITIWLDAPVDVLAERTARRTTRPLLKNANPKET